MVFLLIKLIISSVSPISPSLRRFSREIICFIHFSGITLFELPIFILLFSQQSLFNNVFIRRKKRSVNSNINVNKISPGDYIVHKNHGIGKFLKIEKINITGDSRDYLVIQYQDGKISVAADQLGSVNRYRSTGNIKPKINKLGNKNK